MMTSKTKYNNQEEQEEASDEEEYQTDNQYKKGTLTDDKMLKNNQILCDMRVMADSKLKSSIHDRWLISKNNSFNIPSPDVVARGQYSEVKSTQNTPPFDDWWNKSLDMIDDWNRIQSIKNDLLTDRTAR
jgi:hypothetical protein